MKVKLLKDGIITGGVVRADGDVVTLDDSFAKHLIKKGAAEAIQESRAEQKENRIEHGGLNVEPPKRLKKD